MKTTIEIQSLKCSGCEATILKNLTNLNNISEVSINLENTTITFDYKETADLETVRNKLHNIGYPMVGEENKFSTKAKSYVSCAVGKMDK